MDKLSFKKEFMEDISKKTADLHANTSPSTSTSSKKNILKSISKNKKIAGTFLLALVFLFLTYGYVTTKHQLSKLSDPKKASQDATKILTSKVSKLVELPNGEMPTVATVNDVSKLKTQSFFKNAQNGDKVLIYNKAGQAILYRPTTNKIVQYSIINLNSRQ